MLIFRMPLGQAPDHAKLRKGRLCTGKTRSQGLKQAVSATFPAKVHHGGQPCPTLPSADSASPLW
jgi:hypothetical protein